MIAHAKLCPTPTEVTPLERPLTCMGWLAAAKVPSPSWPSELSPQHVTPPLPVIAQAEFHPAETLCAGGVVNASALVAKPSGVSVGDPPQAARGATHSGIIAARDAREMSFVRFSIVMHAE
jgi:hypothetical protein